MKAANGAYETHTALMCGLVPDKNMGNMAEIYDFYNIYYLNFNIGMSGDSKK